MNGRSENAIGENGRRSRDGRAWSWGIAGAYTIFVGLVLGFVSFALTQEVNLVSADYYQREIAHQQHIDSVRRAQALPAGMAWSVQRAGADFDFSFPPRENAGPLRGTIHLYRPDDARLDRQYAIALDAQGKQRVPAADLSPGAWRAKISWQMHGEQYYSELPLSVE